MEVKLKQGTEIIATHESGVFLKIDETVIFTCITESKIPLYDSEGKKLFFPKNHELSGCGFPEDMFEIS
jgi:hypothetical protein